MASPVSRGKIEADYRQCLVGRDFSLESKYKEAAIQSYRAILQEVEPPSINMVFDACSSRGETIQPCTAAGSLRRLLEDGFVRLRRQ